MQFASPLPWWLVPVVVAGIGALSFFAYRRPLVPLTPAQRTTLILLRALSLALVVVFLCRPVVFTEPEGGGEAVVPVLIDTSRSMRIADVAGQPAFTGAETRLMRATALVREQLIPALEGTARVEVFAVGDAVEPTPLERLQPVGARSDLDAAVAAVSDRVSGRAVAGLVLLSDGGATTTATRERPNTERRLPVLAVGVGSPSGPPDREIVSLVAGEPSLDESSIDLRVSLVSRGLGEAPFQVRVTANGQLIDSRTLTPPADGTPIDEVFTVSPDSTRATVYTAQLAGGTPDAVPENDTQSTLVGPAGRKRRLLLIAGAPGYDQTFLARALGADPGFEIDSIIRKGRNDQNADTFLVQATGRRGPLLTGGFPATREALFAYDAIVLANVDGDALSRAQLALTAEFVAVRGGGLIVLGGRSFEQRGLIGTALEEALPVELSDRRGGARMAVEEGPAPRRGIAVTPEGRAHPVMRIGATADDSKTKWESLPALAATAAVGAPRAGASVLAVTTSPSGAVVPVIAVQRYGRGRSMVFAGEGAWRWRMMLPSDDRRYETFWRQSLRWLAASAGDPVTITVADHADPGVPLPVDIDVRDAAFAPVPDATVTARLTGPDGQPAPLTLRPSGGRFVASPSPAVPGLHRLDVDARRGSALLGTVDRWILVGGRDREMAEPRLNDGVLRRLARDSSGAYVPAAEYAHVISELRTRVPRRLDRVRRDLWHEPWAFGLVIAVLAAEWSLRRRWGLR